MVKMRRSSGRRMALWWEALQLAAIAAESARARSRTKARISRSKRRSASIQDFLPTETLTRISVELCPNSNSYRDRLHVWLPGLLVLRVGGPVVGRGIRVAGFRGGGFRRGWGRSQVSDWAWA